MLWRCKNDKVLLFSIRSGYACLNWTDLGAVTAIVAKFRVDYIFGIAWRDGIFRTFGQAVITQDTLIVYVVGHSVYSCCRIKKF
jgi:hypothetical protein